MSGIKYIRKKYRKKSAQDLGQWKREQSADTLAGFQNYSRWFPKIKGNSKALRVAWSKILKVNKTLKGGSLKGKTILRSLTTKFRPTNSCLCNFTNVNLNIFTCVQLRDWRPRKVSVILKVMKKKTYLKLQSFAYRLFPDERCHLQLQ